MIMDISEIKKLRKKLELTQSGLAKLASVSQSLIAKIEAGKIDPTWSNTKKIFDVLSSMSNKGELKAENIMNPRIISIKNSQEVKEAISIMRKYGISQLPVIDNDHVSGMVTEAILIDALIENKEKHLRIKEVKGEAPPVIPKEASSRLIAELLRHYPLVLVSGKDKLLGIITKSDLLRSISG